MNEEVKVLDNLDEEEAYLFAILSDMSGLDQAEFLWHDGSSEDHLKLQSDGTKIQERPAPSGCFRAWPFQWPWWRTTGPLQIDQCGRSLGKSLSIMVRACAFPYLFPGQEMVITAPELVHLEPIVSLIESRIYSTRALREMMPRGKSAITHRPFQANFVNGSRLIGRIPQRDGKGVKGCVVGETLILTDVGFKRADEIQVGDQVFTHRHRYMPVTHVIEDVNDCYEVKGQGSHALTVSCDHRFYGAENTATPKQARHLLPLAWHDVEHLREHKVYWATPTCFPPLPVPSEPTHQESDSPRLKQGTLPTDDREFWWIVGRYLADGFLSMDKKRNKARKVHIVAPEFKQEEIFKYLEMLGINSWTIVRDHSDGDVIEFGSSLFYRYFDEHFGRTAPTKRIPAFVLGLPFALRGAVLEGYCAGDGWLNTEGDYWDMSSASKELTLGLQMLGQSLKFGVTCSGVQPKTTHINGVALKSKPKYAWKLKIRNGGNQVRMDDYQAALVRSVEPVGKQTVYNIVVDEDHSYLSNSIMSHNIHPIWLELDEMQDYPHLGFVELRETLKRGFEGATWRAHGVTKGVRDDFYEITQDAPGNPWKVHRFAAMWRPNWTDQERTEAILKYGSREDPDYRRNILGLHGDKTNPIFVLTQIMKGVDSDKLSEYNSNEYFKAPIKVEQLEMWAQDITESLDFPAGHLTYAGSNPNERSNNPQAIYWCGMDVGFTIDPSEILVFVEYREKPRDPITKIKLLTRISLVRMPHREQIKAILHTIDFYKPKTFAMDKGGNGLPLFQEMQEHIEAFRARDWQRIPEWMRRYDLEFALTTIKGYNFSEKLIVDFDKSVEMSPYADQDDLVSQSGMKRNAKEYSTDVLREMVDRVQLLLPWDEDLLKQFQGGTWTSNRSMDAYGRRTFSTGNDHVLDAARFMALGWAQSSIEELLRKETAEPVFDAFVFL